MTLQHWPLIFALKFINNTAPVYLNQDTKKFFAMNGQKPEFRSKKQQGIPLIHEKIKLDIGFRADAILNNKVIIEIKSIETLNDIHFKQVLTYLRLSNLKLGLLVNFNTFLFKDGIKRVANKL